MNRLLAVFLLCSNTIIVLPIVHAASAGEQIATKGNNKGAVACAVCHGAKGEGNASAGYPYLAGQSSAYLQHQLHGFAQGKRTSPVMQPFAKALSDKERKEVADYYAQLPLPTQIMEKSKADQETLVLGKTLFNSGKWQDGVPACIQCHGNKGQGLPPHFPPISGQPYSYLKNQLDSWKKSQRSNDPQGLMQAVVSKLSEKEIESVAHYLTSIAPATPKK